MYHSRLGEKRRIDDCLPDACFKKPKREDTVDNDGQSSSSDDHFNSCSTSNAPPAKSKFSQICSNATIIAELGKHIPVVDIVKLYSVSRTFHDTLDSCMLSSVQLWAKFNFPDAAAAFPFQLCARHLVPDPSGRTWATQLAVSDANLQQTRAVPGLKYLQLVASRDRTCRQIKAVLARNGHRLPSSSHATLLKLWLLLEVATTSQRGALLRNQEVWLDTDLYNAQMLFVKLGMHFNDPIYGPSSYELLHLMLGQKGLYPLWQLLTRNRFRNLSEILELKMRYDFQVRTIHNGAVLHCVPRAAAGQGHKEGWGSGHKHLLRPDELVPIEATIRGLRLQDHIVAMMLWGYMDRNTGENLVPTEDELYISDEENVLKYADTSSNWRPKHAKKKRWAELSAEEQREIVDEEDDERLRAMAWHSDGMEGYESGGDNDDDDDEDEYDLEAEIRRGYVIPYQAKGHVSTVPQVDDTAGWLDFVNETIRGLTLEVSDDAWLRAQPFLMYDDEENADEWDWQEMLEQAGETTDNEDGLDWMGGA